MRPSGTAIAVAIIALVIATPIIGVAVLRAIDDRPMLRDVRVRALPLFEETSRLIDSAFEPRPHPGNDPEGPLDIASDPFGYQHCDAWRDWILPGWSAATWQDFDVDGESSRAGIVASVQGLWERQDGELTINDPTDARPLVLQRGEITYTLAFPENPDMPPIPDGLITVSISCLPVN